MRKIILMTVIAVTAILLISCKSTFECDLCGRTVTGKKHVSVVDGEKMTICDEDYKDLMEMKEAFDE